MSLTPVVNKLLTNVSNGLFQKDFNYLCEDLFPVLEVKESSGLLGKYGNAHLRIEHSLMGGRAAARRVEPITKSTTTYNLEDHGLEGFVSQRDYQNSELPYDAEKDETEGVTTMILVGKEYAVASALSSSSNLTQYTTLSGTDQLNDWANSDPLDLASDAAATIKSGSGTRMNTLITSWEVMNKLQYHPQILGQLGFAYARPGGLSYDDVAKALGVQKIKVGDAPYNSAKQGQTDVLAPIWGKHMIFAYIPDRAAPYQKSLGYYVRQKGVGSRKVMKESSFNPPGTKILVMDNYQYLLSDVTCAYLVVNAIA